MVNGEPLTYKALLTRVRTVASLLDGRGVRRGDRVAILSENMTQWGIAYFAVTGMGAVAVPIMTEFQPAQIENIIDHAGCKAIIVSARLRDKIARAAGAGPAIGIEELSSLPEAPFEFPAVAEEDLAAIIYTSGTTGHSKGVMLTHRNIVFDALATHPLVHVRRTDRLLSILTLAHAYECTLGLVAALSCGAIRVLSGQAAFRDCPYSRAPARAADNHPLRAARDRKDRTAQKCSLSWRRSPSTGCLFFAASSSCLPGGSCGRRSAAGSAPCRSGAPQ